MANGVKIRHKLFDMFMLKWRRCRDAVAGQDAIYAGAQLYLAPLKDEDNDEYLKRLRRTPFYNATWRTIGGFVGMLFRKPPVLEVPKQIEKLLEDVTMTGVSFSSFAQDVALEDLTVSRVGVLVDHPRQVTKPDGSALSVAEAERLGLRPSMIMYKAENIINWRYQYIGNRNVLTQVRLLETVTIDRSEFETEEEARVRVLDLFEGRYRVRLYKEDDETQIGSEMFPLLNGKPLDFIPFYFIGPDGTDAKLEEPVLIDLVDLNIKHFQVSADYEHGCHMTGLPTPVISGYQEQGGFIEGTQTPVQERKFYIGSTTAWVFPNAEAKAEFLEFKGTGLKSLEANLDRKEAQMAAIGARMLAPEKKAAEAAETLAQRHSGEYSVLAAIAIAVSQGLTQALKTFMLWAGVDAEPKFEINRDFTIFLLTPQLLAALLQAVQAGRMSHEAFFDILKRGDLVEADLDFAIEQARIEADPSLPKPGDEKDPDDGLDDNDDKE
jgi:hypothetical protein